jgi:hypothetical protein
VEFAVKPIGENPCGGGEEEKQNAQKTVDFHEKLG